MSWVDDALKKALFPPPPVYVRPTDSGSNKPKTKAEAAKSADEIQAQAVKIMQEIADLERIANKYYQNYLDYLPFNPGAAQNWKNKETEVRNQIATKRKLAETLFSQANDIRAQAGLDSADRPSQGPNDPRSNSPKKPGTTTPTPKPAAPYEGPYKYNLPMVKSAYFRPLPNNPQQLSVRATVSSPEDYRDAINAWELATSGNASKGALQMDRILSTTAQKPKGKAAKDYDDTMYGFRFLYNPSSVSMSWGISTEVNWDYVSGGFDKATPLAEGLLKSTISFSLLINRIEDFKYLSGNGLRWEIIGGIGTDPETSGGIGALSQADNPYPVNVSGRTSDLQEIYKKGTMYDIEYLFKTIMGKNATYTSSLNGKTADRGWLNGTPVELHLGDGLRYRVRISDLSISHALFNDRMVPLLSTLNVTCTRFYDAPDYTFTSSSNTETTTTKTTSTSTSKAVTSAQARRQGADT